MSIFDNIGGNLLDLFMNYERREDTASMAQRAEVDEKDFGKIIALGLPILLQAINRNNNDTQGLASFSQALDQHQDVKQYNSFGELVNKVDTNDGDRILGHVFDDQQGIFERIATTLGVTPGAVKRVLMLLAPIVLKYLADRKQTNRLDNAGVQKETGNIAEQMARSVREYGQNSGNNNSASDALGNIFDGLTQGQSNNTVDKKDGFLDSILDFFR
ncbi:DUF937 domain-containing protein [Fundicoccus sp. Sow4_F4]|uniref:DUF937 domain-containing protein n=1 Tax=Fundicoccus sp. Sow4_F4 TaxID=3438783 RepID=UPI003F92A5B4